MSPGNGLIYKIADDLSEFNQIHKLNYSTFVEEIPQHSENVSGELVDKFHDQNTYIVCLENEEVVGMIAVRDKRPFSLDSKMKDLDSYLPPSNSICEIRLLSIKKSYRNRKVISGLFSLLAEYCEKNNYDLALISATTRQLKLYKKLGFSEFGHIVGSDEAYYQPMYLTPDSYMEFKQKSNILKIRDFSDKEEIIFLPGPVNISGEVTRAFQSPPLSHRSEKFIRDFNYTKKALCMLTGCGNVEILMGSGTVANDAIAGQLSGLNERGLILTNGHFGERLVDHARRFSLEYDLYDISWGNLINIKELEGKLNSNSYGWLWFVNCETSTGMINGIEEITDLCSGYSVRVCVDCISSLGSFELDLKDVYLASGVSGKAIASYPGLSFVFYNRDNLKELKNIPRYIDIGFYKNKLGIPFTLSSNLLYALKAALEQTDIDATSQKHKKYNKKIRRLFDGYGIQAFIGIENSSSDIITFKMPDHVSSVEIGKYFEKKGILISYMSEYLVKKNLIQIALMGQVSETSVERFSDELSRFFNQPER